MVSINPSIILFGFFLVRCQVFLYPEAYHPADQVERQGLIDGELDRPLGIFKVT